MSLDAVNQELWRRQQGYGRGGRMKIETDTVEIVAGVRHSITIGSPVALIVRNADWKNWTEILPVERAEDSAAKTKPVTRPRPGHADLAGCLKYDFHDARYILERASARETTMRVAAGAMAKALLKQFGIDVLSHVIAVGAVRLDRPVAWEELVALRGKPEVLLGCVDEEVEQRMKGVVDEAYRTGDTIGGVFEVVAHNGLPVRAWAFAHHLGRAAGWPAGAGDCLHSGGERRRGRLGGGRRGRSIRLESPGHHPLRQRSESRFTRGANRAGGLEGGITNGQDLLVRGYVEADLHPAASRWNRWISRPAKPHWPRLTNVQRCVCGAGGGCGGRGHGGNRPGFRHSWKNLAATLWARRAAITIAIMRASEGLLTDMVYPIVKFGDPGAGDAGEADDVTEFDTPELNKLLDDMFESMYAAKGVGLAAPQIGIVETHRRHRRLQWRRSRPETRPDQSGDCLDEGFLPTLARKAA